VLSAGSRINEAGSLRLRNGAGSSFRVAAAVRRDRVPQVLSHTSFLSVQVTGRLQV